MKRTWRIAPIVVGLVLAASIGFVLWEARRAFQRSAVEVAASSELKFQTISIEPVTFAGVESFAAPAAFTDAVIFEGKGSGHGLGLCQQGASAMAHDGASFREILAHYFPNTTLGD